MPRNYDDIVRRTVLDPDSSQRPTRAQEELSREGFRALDDDERALQSRAIEALSGSGANVAGVEVEVTRDLITLRGRVPEARMLGQIEDALAGLPGVHTIHNQIVVAA